MEEAGHSGTLKVGVQGNGHGEVAVSVADSGPGIAPGDAERIFDPFYSTKEAGLGVGLSISRAIIEAHGGRLSLDTERRRRKRLPVHPAGHERGSLTECWSPFSQVTAERRRVPIRRGRIAPRSLARLFIAVAALCVVAMPLRAAERETRVLILNGMDPTLPAFLAHDAAMRDTLAKNTTQRFQFFSEALDSHRFAFRRLRAGVFGPAAEEVQRRDVRCGRSGIGTSAQFRTQAQERTVAERLGLLPQRAATGDSRHRVRSRVRRASSRAGP